MPRGRDEMQVNVAGLRRNIKNLAHNYSDAQVKVREATSNDPWGPSSTLMAEIADLTYNVMAFTEIMQMIWKRLNDHGKNWRHVYKALVLMEYLIKTGSEKVAMQCKENIYAIHTLKDFQYMEEGKDQGLNVREKAKQLVNLLKDEERLKNERARALKAKQRFAQSASAFGSDGALDTPSSPTYPPSEGSGSGWTAAAAAAELARPLTAGEEELQLQLALAMSREEAERDERRRRSDDVRLQLAISQSQNDFQIQEAIRREYLRQEFLRLPPIIEQPYNPNKNPNYNIDNCHTTCHNVNYTGQRNNQVPYSVYNQYQNYTYQNFVCKKEISFENNPCPNYYDSSLGNVKSDTKLKFEAYQMNSNFHQNGNSQYTVFTNDVRKSNDSNEEWKTSVPYLNEADLTVRFDSDRRQENFKDWNSGNSSTWQNMYGEDYGFWMCGECFNCLQKVQATPPEKKPEQSHLLDLLDVSLSASAPAAALDPWGVPAAHSVPDTSADAWSGVGSPPREPWAAPDPWAPAQLQSKSPVSALSSPSSGELEQFDALSQRRNNNNPEPDPFDLTGLGTDLMQSSSPSTGAVKKSPSAFLGENSGLVNLERLLQPAPPPHASPAPNPFADTKANAHPPPVKLSINELKQQQMGLSGLSFTNGSGMASNMGGGMSLGGGAMAAGAADPWAAPARTHSPWSPQNQRHTPNPFLS